MGLQRVRRNQGAKHTGMCLVLFLCVCGVYMCMCVYLSVCPCLSVCSQETGSENCAKETHSPDLDRSLWRSWKRVPGLGTAQL